MPRVDAMSLCRYITHSDELFFVLLGMQNAVAVCLFIYLLGLGSHRQLGPFYSTHNKRLEIEIHVTSDAYRVFNNMPMKNGLGILHRGINEGIAW